VEPKGLQAPATCAILSTFTVILTVFFKYCYISLSVGIVRSRTKATEFFSLLLAVVRIDSRMVWIIIFYSNDNTTGDLKV
jgi:hypothetical protein